MTKYFETCLYIKTYELTMKIIDAIVLEIDSQLSTLRTAKNSFLEFQVEFNSVAAENDLFTSLRNSGMSKAQVDQFKIR